MYFLSVGSGDYVRANPPSHGFNDLDGADASAQRIAALLAKNGATFGVLLQSEPEHFVTRDDVISGVHYVVERIRTDRALRPLFVFYWMGHGVSEGLGWNHYAIPGNFTYRRDQDLEVDNLSKNAIYDGAVTDILDKSGSAYVMILDTCTSGKAEQSASGILSREAAANANDVSNVIRNLNEFHQANPVIFSARPGTDVAPAPDPRDDTVLIGPLARRATILIDKQSRPNISLETFVRTLSSQTFDSETSAGVTFAESDASSAQLMFFSRRETAEITKRTGTGKSAH